jgi:hypothetical protein
VDEKLERCMLDFFSKMAEKMRKRRELRTSTKAEIFS